MLEYPMYPALLIADQAVVTMCRVGTISRKPAGEAHGDPQRLHARPGYDPVKIQSDLHGDMQSQTEMFWSLTGNWSH